MSVSAVQIVTGSHQQSGEQDSGSPRLAGGDPLLCKKPHLNPFCVVLYHLHVFISAGG